MMRPGVSGVQLAVHSEGLVSVFMFSGVSCVGIADVFSADEAERLARNLMDAARESRAMKKAEASDAADNG